MILFLEISYYAGWALLFGVIACGCWRMAIGPTTLDRLVGFDTLAVGVLGLIILFSIRTGTPEYLEFVLIMTALGFFATVCYYYYLSQPRKRGGEDFNQEEDIP